jgi:hypothetical protein
VTALLLFGDTERSAALRHEVPLAIIDPFLFAEVDGRRVVLTTRLERERIAAALPDAELLDVFELGLKELLVEHGMRRDEAMREVVARAVRRIGLREAVVPGDFPVAVADRLRSDGVRLAVDDVQVEGRRRAKTGHELEAYGPRSVPPRTAWRLRPRCSRARSPGPVAACIATAPSCMPRRCAPRCAMRARTQVRRVHLT